MCSAPVELVLVLVLPKAKQARDAGDSERCYSSHRHSCTVSGYLLEDRQLLMDWEEGKACKILVSTLGKEVQF